MDRALVVQQFQSCEMSLDGKLVYEHWVFCIAVPRPSPLTPGKFSVSMFLYHIAVANISQKIKSVSANIKVHTNKLAIQLKNAKTI